MCNYEDLLIEVLKKHNNHKKWNNAKFSDIKILSNSKVGVVGQDFIELLLKRIGLNYSFPLNKKGLRATQSPWDIKIENITFELKTATEDISGNFQFNHIRYHRDYNAVMCLGISPDSLYFGIWSKADVSTGKAGTLVSMEKNANASYKLTKSINGLFHIDKFEEKIKEFLNGN